MKFSPSTKGFYDPKINKITPEDVIEISPDLYTSLIEGQSQGKIITVNSEGFPTLSDYKVTPLDRITELESEITKRRIREAVLSEDGKRWLEDQEALIAEQRGLL